MDGRPKTQNPLLDEETAFIAEIKRFLRRRPNGARPRDVVKGTQKPVRDAPTEKVKEYLKFLADKGDIYEIEGSYFVDRETYDSSKVKIDGIQLTNVPYVAKQNSSVLPPNSIKTLSRYAGTTYQRVAKKLGTDDISEILIFLAAYWEGSHSAATLIDPSLNFEPDEMP